MLPSSITKVLAGSSANNISLSQSLAGAGNLLLNGSTGGVLDTQRRVAITSAGNDSGMTWTVTGTDDANNVVVDKFAGGNGATVAQSNFDFKTVTQIAGSAATAAAVTAGTNGTGSSPWKNISTMHSPSSVSVAVAVSGAGVVYTCEYTYDPYWVAPPLVPAIFPIQTLVGQSTNGEGTPGASAGQPVTGVRLTVTAGTGTARMTVIDAGDLGP